MGNHMKRPQISQDYVKTQLSQTNQPKDAESTKDETFSSQQLMQYAAVANLAFVFMATGWQ